MWSGPVVFSDEVELRLPRNCVAPSGVLDVVVGSGIVSDDTEINSVVVLKNGPSLSNPKFGETKPREQSCEEEN